MSKKLLIGFVPLLVTVAFAATPMAAQAAEPIFKLNSVAAKAGKKVPTVTWGTLELKSALGIVKCHVVDAGWIENPTGGLAGIGATENFIPFFFPCEAPGCPGEIKIIGEGLSVVPEGTNEAVAESWWPSVLIRSTNATTGEPDIRALAGNATKPVKVKVQCTIKGTGLVVNTVFKGENEPEQVNGGGYSKPAYGEFGAGSGGLVSSEYGGSETVGRDKVMGYEEQEVISTE